MDPQEAFSRWMQGGMTFGCSCQLGYEQDRILQVDQGTDSGKPSFSTIGIGHRSPRFREVSFLKTVPRSRVPTVYRAGIDWVCGAIVFLCIIHAETLRVCI